jgi:hypothetical protein
VVDGQCLPCVEPCKTCSTGQSTCTSCIIDTMFDAAAGNCQNLCKALAERNCVSCDDKTGSCLMCKPGYAVSNGNCVKYECNIRNCISCSNSSICQVCAVGYQVDKGSCFICTQNCSSCPSGYEFSPTKSCISISNKEPSTPSITPTPTQNASNGNGDSISTSNKATVSNEVSTSGSVLLSVCLLTLFVIFIGN